MVIAFKDKVTSMLYKVCDRNCNIRFNTVYFKSLLMTKYISFISSEKFEKTDTE